MFIVNKNQQESNNKRRKKGKIKTIASAKSAYGKVGVIDVKVATTWQGKWKIFVKKLKQINKILSCPCK